MVCLLKMLCIQVSLYISFNSNSNGRTVIEMGSSVFLRLKSFYFHILVLQVYKKTERIKVKTAVSRLKRSIDFALNSKLVKLTENNTPKKGQIYINTTDEDGKFIY